MYEYVKGKRFPIQRIYTGGKAKTKAKNQRISRGASLNMNEQAIIKRKIQLRGQQLEQTHG